jgi:hypothetical protein
MIYCAARIDAVTNPALVGRGASLPRTAAGQESPASGAAR